MLGDDRALYDFWGKSTSGPRNGMFVGQHIIDEIVNDPQTACFNQMWIDYALCNPYRTTFLSGQTRLHHDNENDEPGFYNKWMQGQYETSPLFARPNQWNGPLFQDLAQQYAHAHSETYDQSYLPQSHWPNVGKTSNMRNGVSYGPGVTFDSSMTGKTVTGTGIPTGTTVTYVSASQLTMSNAATTTKSGTVIIGGTTICCGTKVTGGSTALKSLCVVGTIGIGTTDDHLQAYSGSLLTWLPAAGAPGPGFNPSSTGVDRVAIYGKLANCYGALTTTDPYNDTAQLNGAGHGSITDEFVPAGVTDCMIVTGDYGATGDIQDHWHMRVVEYHGTKTDNPSWGTGAHGTTYVYRYNHCIDNIAWDTAHSQLVVTISAGSDANGPCDGPCTFQPHELALVKVGEEVAIQGCAVTQYNNTQWIIDSITATQIRISHDVNNVAATNHGTAAGGSSVQASPRSLFSEWIINKKVLAFYASVKDSESFFCYVPSRMCHAEVAGNGVPAGLSDQTDGNSIGFEEELRYYNTVDATTQPHCWGRIPNAVSPAVGSADLPLTGAQQGIWSRRREMDCSFDDAAYSLLSYLDGRWGRYGHDVAIGSDNGWQQLDHNFEEVNGATGSRIGAKGYNYAASQMCPVYWRAGIKPWRQTGNIDYPVAAQDLAPAVLRLFSRQYPKLKHHHIGITGDGIALQDVMDAHIDHPDGPIAQRGFLLIGQYHTGQGSPAGNKHSGAFLSADRWRYVVAAAAPTDHRLWNLNDVAIADTQWSSAAGGTMTVSTATPHGKSTGDRIWVYANPTNFNVAGSTAAGGYHVGPAITVVDSTHFTYASSSPGATFRSGVLYNDWETVDQTSAYPDRNTIMALRLTAQQAAGFDASTRRSALETTGSGSPSLDVDGNAAPVGNGNTTRTA